MILDFNAHMTQKHIFCQNSLSYSSDIVQLKQLSLVCNLFSFPKCFTLKTLNKKN